MALGIRLGRMLGNAEGRGQWTGRGKVSTPQFSHIRLQSRQKGPTAPCLAPGSPDPQTSASVLCALCCLKAMVNGHCLAGLG